LSHSTTGRRTSVRTPLASLSRIVAENTAGPVHMIGTSFCTCSA
jgi:hypothetical protein